MGVTQRAGIAMVVTLSVVLVVILLGFALVKCSEEPKKSTKRPRKERSRDMELNANAGDEEAQTSVVGSRTRDP